MYEDSLEMRWRHAFENTARAPASSRGLVLNAAPDRLLTLW